MLSASRAVIAIALAAVVIVLAFVGGSAPAQQRDDPMKPVVNRGDRYVPKPAGTTETMKFYFGPYTVPPGHDANRVDLELPVQNGYIPVSYTHLTLPTTPYV